MADSPSGIIEDHRVMIVVASRNRRAELMSSLRRHRAPVIYVDNASTDGSARAVQQHFPQVHIVRLKRNAGAYGRTVGVRRAPTPFVAFADDDSWWAPGALRSAAGALAGHDRLALVNARILVGDEERLDPTCDQMARSPLPGAPGVPGAPVLGFIACAAMVRRDAFLEAGGFDHVVRFPGEEERLALDLADLGWQLRYLDDAVVHHHTSPHRDDPDRRHRALARSSVLTAALRMPPRHAVARTWRTITMGAPHRAGVLDAARDLPGALRHRRRLSDLVLAQAEMLRLAGARTAVALQDPKDGRRR